MSSLRIADFTKTFKIVTNDYSYILTITKKSDSSFIIKLGGYKKRDCITLITYGEGQYKNIATLPFIKKDSDCAINKSLESGTHLINTGLTFIKKISHIQYVLLDDVSNIKCSNGRDLSLACFYFVRYQETWYEKNFGAELESEKDRDSYLILKNNWNISHNKIPTNDFIIYLKNWNISNETIDILSSIYEKTSTYKEFFDTLFELEGKNKSCILLQHWLDQFMNVVLHFGLYNRTWRIPTEKIVPVKLIQREEIVGGGSRYTRKMNKLKSSPSYHMSTTFSWNDLD